MRSLCNARVESNGDETIAKGALIAKGGRCPEALWKERAEAVAAETEMFEHFFPPDSPKGRERDTRMSCKLPSLQHHPHGGSTFDYLERRSCLLNPRPPRRWESSSRGLGAAVSRRLPYLLRERPLDIGKTDKVFASDWITEEDVVVGTKCNKLFVVNTENGSIVDIPRLQPEGSSNSTSSCGIHTISVSSERQYLAAGGADPTHLAVYGLPEMQPLAIGEGHTDWLFDMQWITDTLLITGARDCKMALWSVGSLESAPPQERGGEATRSGPMAEDVQKLEPIVKFSNLAGSARSSPSHCERVRSLAYNRQKYTLASLQTNACGAIVHFWDLFSFIQTVEVEMPFCAENVCMEFDEESGHVYGVGSRSHVTFLDDRVPASTVGSLKSLDPDCGIRSLKFNHNLLSIGTGAGHVYFYDMRTRHYLSSGGCSGTSGSRGQKPAALSLTATGGWLRRDETYRSFFSGMPEPLNAIYTHCYSPARTKLFTAGGPLPLGLHGNYAGVWV